MILGRLASLVTLLVVIVACGWIVGNIRAISQMSFEVAPTMTAIQADYLVAKAEAEAKLITAQGSRNYNNAQATAVIVDSNGEYAVNIARATQIVADSDQGPVNTYNAGVATGEKLADERNSIFGNGFGLGFMGIAVLGVIAFLIYAATR